MRARVDELVARFGQGPQCVAWHLCDWREKGDEPADPDEVGRVAVVLEESPLSWFTGCIDADNLTSERFSTDGRHYLTGEVGWQDADGFFHFSARDDDIILMAGYRIGPGEIGNVIGHHEAVPNAGSPPFIRGQSISSKRCPGRRAASCSGPF